MLILQATILSFLVGISGTMVGGVLILSRSSPKLPQQSWLLGFSGGIMIAVVLFDLWPEAWYYGGLVPSLGGALLGWMLVWYSDMILRLLPWYRRHQFAKLTKVGLLLGLGIGVHNFPEGVALGTTYIANPAWNHWLGLGLLMMIHNIPEGMVMSASFKFGKVRLEKIIAALILVEVPMGFGGTLGGVLGQISEQMVSLSLGFAGGAMFLLVFKELLPLAKKMAGSFWVGSGLMVGMLVGVLLVRMV